MSSLADGEIISAETGSQEQATGGFRVRRQNGLRDIGKGLSLIFLWGYFGFRDATGQFRGTILGPGWSVLGNLLFVVGIASLFSNWMSVDFIEFLPHVGIGFTVWTFLSRVLNESSRTFVTYAPIIREIPLPLSFHIFRVLWKCLMLFFLDVVGLSILFAVFQVHIEPIFWEGVLGFLILLSGMAGAAFLLATLGIFVRSLIPLLELSLRFMFFFIPIIWMDAAPRFPIPNMEYNPFAIALRICREPFITGSQPDWVWTYACVMAATLIFLGAAVFLSFHRRVRLKAVGA